MTANARARALLSLVCAGVALVTIAGSAAPHHLSGSIARSPAHVVRPSATATATSSPPLPDRVIIPVIGVDASLIPLGLNSDGTVEVPSLDDPLDAGWYHYGPAPGEIGPAVVLGHVDSRREAGVFYRLHDLRPGDTAEIGRSDGSRLAFVVTRIEQAPKTSFPTQSVYGDTPDPELRLVTCGGSFDRAHSSYRDNIIVFATLRP
jgi:sortase (surface protein transpeptidase)